MFMYYIMIVYKLLECNRSCHSRCKDSVDGMRTCIWPVICLLVHARDSAFFQFSFCGHVLYCGWWIVIIGTNFASWCSAWGLQWTSCYFKLYQHLKCEICSKISSILLAGKLIYIIGPHTTLILAYISLKLTANENQLTWSLDQKGLKIKLLLHQYNLLITIMISVSQTRNVK